MKVVFVSNFLNHHQIPFCEEMKRLCDSFYFVATENGASQGFQTTADGEYTVDYKLEKEKAEQLILSADAVIFGACPNELISLRAKENKLSFLYSERFFKKGVWRRFIPSTRKAVIDRAVRYKDKNFFVLCASAYLAYDLSFFGFKTEKCLKWGYFPEVKKYESVDKLIAEKKPDSILWAGRLIDWKHPETPVQVAKHLKKDGCNFTLDIIGDGELYAPLSQMIQKEGLSDCVRLLGPMEPKQVREHMEKSEIFLFTSNRKEGWGAVLNEAMNSGCAVVANRAAGSVPFLLKDGENGLVYDDKSPHKLYKKVKRLLDNPLRRQEIAQNAYRALADIWNSKTAAERLTNVISEISANGMPPYYEDGPCSLAGIIHDNWRK